VEGIKVKTGPVNDQYLGRPVDLEGTVLEVYYSDGTKEPITYSSGNFTAYPRVFTGYYAWEYNIKPSEIPYLTFKGMPDVEINYKGFHDKAGFSGKAWGIVLTNAKNADKIDGPIWSVEDANYSMGLNLVGTAAKEAYVDDDSFDFSGLTLEADYFYVVSPPKGTIGGSLGMGWWIDTITEQAKSLRDKKAISFGDITYKIMPSYQDSDGKSTKDDSTGYVSITVGADFNHWVDDAWDYNSATKEYTVKSGTNPNGVTTTHELNTVHIIQKIALASQPNFDDYYYWQENNRAAWLERLGDDAKLVITYSGGKTATKSLKDLAEKAKIWWNEKADSGRFDQNTDQLDVSGIYDFDIVPIQYPLTVKANPEPGITLYYRGATTKVPVDVLTTLVSISAVSATDGDIIYDPAQKSDNDIRVIEAELADLLNVTAIYQAYNDANVQSKKPLTLTYKGNVPLSDNPNSRSSYTPYYSFDKGSGDDTTLDSLVDKWEKAVLAGKKDSIVQAVTVSHSVREYDFYGDINGNLTLSAISTDTGSRFADPSDNTSPYPFAGIPNFKMNLVRTPKTYDGSGDVVVGDRGWIWMYNTSNNKSDGTPLGSGIKQPAKAKTDKPSVTWVVKD